MENLCLLLNGAGDRMTKDIEKAKVFNVAFTSIFTDKTSLQESQVPESSVKVQSQKDLPSMEENQLREHLNKLDVHRSMGPEGMYQEC